ILLNLLSNAIKFTDNGEVIVRTSVDGVEDGKCRVKFSVVDTGIGISGATASRLFQPFVQADNSISRKFGGTGLGLSIAKALVDLMAGQIGLESTEGNGSPFW